MLAVLLDADSLRPSDIDLSGFDTLNLKVISYATTTPEQCQARIAEADIIFTNKVVLNAALLAAAPKCRYIGVLATGVNNVDVAYCRQAGIHVQNVEGYGTHSVTQHAMMLLLNLATQFTSTLAQVRRGEWAKSPFFCLLDHPVIELAGKHLVIVGYGTLGKRFGQLAEALGMQVSIAARPGQAVGQGRIAFDEVLPSADVVSLHCQLSEDTQHLMNQARFRAMKSTAFLINTARGGLIDEAALLDALETGEIAGAGLDGLSVEPPPADHPLLNADLPQLLITPHSAWAAREARQRLVDIAIAHLRDYLDNRHAP